MSGRTHHRMAPGHRLEEAASLQLIDLTLAAPLDGQGERDSVGQGCGVQKHALSLAQFAQPGGHCVKDAPAKVQWFVAADPKAVPFKQGTFSELLQNQLLEE